MRQFVVGLGFGDEGKGHVVDYLFSEQKDIYTGVRYTGGQQAAHRVITEDGKDHVFHHFSSGTFRGANTVWIAKTMNPLSFMREYSVLRDLFEIKPFVHIAPECLVTTPWDYFSNRQDDTYLKNGTTGAGYGKTIQRDEDHFRLRFLDLMFPSVLETKLELIREKYYKEPVPFDRISNNYIEEWKSAAAEVPKLVSTWDWEQKDTIWECSQGLLLDQDYGYFPYVTRSHLGTQELELKRDDKFYLVTRCYTTRHGAGPMNCPELKTELQNLDEQNTAESSAAGEFRFGILNLDQLAYSIAADYGILASEKTLVITCMDQVKEGEFSLYYKGKTVSNLHSQQFVELIKEALSGLGIGNYLLSYGPTAKDFVKA